MPTLEVHLQEGFADDEVVVRLAGREVRRTGVRTRTQVGVAAVVELEGPDGPARLEVEVPARALRRSVTVDAAHTPYVGVSVVDGGIQLQSSQQLFRYA